MKSSDFQSPTIKAGKSDRLFQKLADLKDQFLTVLCVIQQESIYHGILKLLEK